jgi:oleate hydratase
MTRPDSPKIDTSRLKTHIDAIDAQAVDVTPDASSIHLHNGLDTLLPPADLHGSYTINRPLPTAGIAERHAYIVGSGIVGLSICCLLPDP